MMAQFRKKPVVIEATQWFQNGDHPQDYSRPREGFQNGDFISFGADQAKAYGWEGEVVRYYRTPDVPGDRQCSHCGMVMHNHGWIDTLEGGHIVCPGDWIITGVQGERYPCKPDIFDATYEPALPDQQEASEPVTFSIPISAEEVRRHMSTPADHGPAAGARDEAGSASEPAPVERLLRELEADRGANRPLDARIAVALYRDTGHADDRDNTHARLPSKSDECAPGTYWIVGFSGMSLRTAPDYTSDRTLKRLALDALRTAPTPTAEPDEGPVELVREFADKIASAAHDCCIDPDGGPDDQTSVNFTGAEGAEIATALHRVAAITPSIRAKALEDAAKVAMCAFDDRPNSRAGHYSEMDWTDGFRDGTSAAAAAIRNLKGEKSS